MLFRSLAVAAVLIWLGVGVWQLRRHGLSRQVKMLEARWVQVQPIEALQAALQAHTQLVQRLVVRDGVPLDWFSRLARDFPGPVRLVDLSVQGTGDVRMDGEAQERGQTPEAYVSELALWLDRSRVCGHVQLGATGRTGADDTLAKFSLTCQLIRN